jgi:hypothetical protein
MLCTSGLRHIPTPYNDRYHSCVVILSALEYFYKVILQKFRHLKGMFPGSRTRVSCPEDVAPRHTLKGSESDLLRGAIEAERLV